MRKWFVRIAAILLPLWLAFVGYIFWLMHRPPMEIAAVFAKMPMPAMMLFPFETMWGQARGGALKPGDLAPDFELPTLDKQSKVRLSDYRGNRPVVLVFGSYT